MRGEAASPAVISESVLITAVIDAKQKRDVMTCDQPSAFVQTEIEQNEIGERIVMKIRGPLLEILVEIDPEKYDKYVELEDGGRTLYVIMLRALYGMISSLLYYMKFLEDLKSVRFKVNPYDPCVANRTVRGSKHSDLAC